MENLTVKLKYLRMTPRKVRLLADTLRGLPVSEAEARLLVSPRRPKEALLKLLRSAIANAKNNHKLEADQLFIRSIRVDTGPRSKRWMPRARGSAAMIQRLTCHVTLVLGIGPNRPSRFTLVRTRPKKVEEKPKGKKNQSEDSKEGKTPKKAETPEAKPKAEPDSFRRIFRRKAI